MKEKTYSNRNKVGRPKKPISDGRLIALATGVFARYGYHATSLDQIAKQAGIHRVSLLHHFKSKKVLYHAVLDVILGDLHDFILSAREASDDFKEALDQLGNSIIDYFGKRAGVARLLLRELVDGGPYFHGKEQQAVLDILAVTTDFLQAGMDAGTFCRQDPRQLALTIVGLHLYYFSATPSTSSFFGKETYTKTGVERRRGAVLAHVRKLCCAETTE